MIVDDEIEIQNSGKTFFRPVDDADRLEKFLARRNQRGPVPLRPRIVLDMRDLEALRADFNRKVDNRGKMVDILTMNRRIDRKTDTERARPSRDVPLFLQASLVAGDSIGVFRIDVLKRNLHVIQPDRREPAQTVFAEQDAGGNEIGIETGLDAVGEDPIEIAAHGWFAA